MFEDTQFVLLTLCKSPGHRDREDRAWGKQELPGNEGFGSREEEMVGVPWTATGSSSSTTGAERRGRFGETEVSSEKH